jgi:metacaspase-1
MQKKLALLIGINYYNTGAKLRGCINDVLDMEDYLLSNGFEISLLIDQDITGSYNGCPTKSNILSEMKKLVARATAGDMLYIHFSGHGTQINDVTNDESDIMDEAICPVDYTTEGIIVDDELHEILVTNLPTDVKLRVVFDSCHSGSALDLPHRWNMTFLGKERFYTESIYNGKNIIMISGCVDNSTSADALFDNRSNGALTKTFLSSLEEIKGKQNWKYLIKSIRDKLKDNKYTQYPQISFMDKNLLDDNLDI